MIDLSTCYESAMGDGWSARAAEAKPRRSGGANGRLLFTLGAGLLAMYWVLSLALSPDAYLSTDVGGKTGALAAMHERGDWSTDLGYWASSSDPDGLVYPYANTTLTGEGWWVNTTSLPMVLAARPLWSLGGAQLVLLLPMLAAVGAALIAGRLQARLDGSSGITATLLVGLATPITVYALDFWEHTPGVFFMALGAWATLRAAERSTASDALAAGLGFGLAATMRQEALVYGFSAGLVLCGASWRAWRQAGDSFVSRLLPCISMAGSAIAVLATSTVAETLYYGQPLRSGRSAGAVGATTSGVADRIASGFITALSPINEIHPVSFVLGALLLAGLLWLAISADRGGDLVRPTIVCLMIAMVIPIRIARFGPNFIPGLIPTTVFAAAGIWFGLTRPAYRLMAAMALVPLPLVFLTHYAAGAVPQWGGRYLLFSGYLLTIVGGTAIAKINRQLFWGLAVAGIAVTASGVWFAAERTNLVDADFELIASASDGDVVVWFSPMTAREGGVDGVGGRWLTTFGNSRTDLVMRVLDDNAIDRFVFVDPIDEPQPVFEGFERSSQVGEWETSRIFSQRLTVYERK